MTMIYQTRQQRANTLDALNNMWPSVPPHNVSPGLGTWRMDAGSSRNAYGDGSYGYFNGAPTCKTISCFGGWCTVWPNFVAQGVKAGPLGSPTLHGYGQAVDVAEQLFGMRDIFSVRHYCFADTGRMEQHLTDHQLVSRRLQYLLDNSRVEGHWYD